MRVCDGIITMAKKKKKMYKEHSTMTVQLMTLSRPGWLQDGHDLPSHHSNPNILPCDTQWQSRSPEVD